MHAFAGEIVERIHPKPRAELDRLVWDRLEQMGGLVGMSTTVQHR